jgi:predicted negative regulator of RcsB-dependent stress response
MAMFFSKLFQKNYRYYLEQGESYLLENRFADAKYSFSEALERIDTTNGAANTDMILLQNRLITVNNKLAELNLHEAEHAINSGDLRKAEEHLNLVIELADDVNIREKAENFLGNLTYPNHSDNLTNNNVGCSGCKTSSDKFSENSHGADDQLSMEDRFDLLIHTLPAPLPERYAALGEKFAYSYVLIHDGDDANAALLLEELLTEDENDINLYELALIEHRRGEFLSCEKLLRRAINLNASNPLCYLGLVQLLSDTARFYEAIPVLEHMIGHGLLPDQARLLLGDVYLLTGGDDKAIENWSEALSLPSVARGAAEKLVSLLQKHGRGEEAAYIAKRYLKSCC